MYFFPMILSSHRYPVCLRIQSEYTKIRTRNNSVFEHFSRSVEDRKHKVQRKH